MPNATFTYQIGGDDLTSDANLYYKIYNFGVLFHTTGTSVNDANVSVNAGVATVINVPVDYSTTYNFTMSEVDEGGLESTPSSTIVFVSSDEVVTGTPTLSNFRIENAEPSKVYFDSSGSISGMTATGFVISGKSISSLSVNGTSTTGHYFTVSTPFTFWDNNTIRLGENDDTVDSQTVIHNFTMEYIVNNINEPTPTAYKYVNVTASGDGSGSSTSNFMTLTSAVQQHTAGTKYYVKAGDYGSSGYNITGGGTASQPVWFEGYKTTPGDNPTITKSNSLTFSSSEMPLISTGSTSGSGLTTNYDYIIVSNFQIEGFNTCFDFAESDYTIANNVYVQDAFEKGFEGFNYDGIQNRVINSYVRNVSNSGIHMSGRHSLIADNYICSTQIENMDYYIALREGTSGTGDLIAINNYIYRFKTDSHSGHGIDIRGGGAGVIQNSLAADNTIYNVAQPLTCRGVSSTYNVLKRNTLYQETGSNAGGFIVIRDGSSYNIFENNIANGADKGIGFRNNPGEYHGIQKAGDYNIIRNNILIDADNFIYEGAIDAANGNMPESVGNKIQNNTIIGNTSTFYASYEQGLGPTNIIENNIFLDNAGGVTGTMAMTFKNNLIVNTSALSSYVGSNGNFDTPNPNLNGSYQPQATFTDIDVPIAPMVYYDYNGVERSDQTTVGAVSHADETPSENIPNKDYGIGALTYSGNNYDAANDTNLTQITGINFIGNDMWIVGFSSSYHLRKYLWNGTTNDLMDITYDNDDFLVALTTQNTAWSDDGLSLIHISNSSSLRRRTAATAFTASSLSSATTVDFSSHGISETRDLKIRGMKMWILCNTTNAIYQFTFTGAQGDISNVSLDGSFSTVSYSTNAQGFDISPDGATLLLLETGSDELTEFSLTTPNDITGTVTFVETINLQTLLGASMACYKIRYTPDGESIVVGDSTAEVIYQFNLNN